MAGVPKVPSSLLHQRILGWYAQEARDLPYWPRRRRV